MDFTGLYDDTAMSTLPQTIASMGCFTMNSDLPSNNKRSNSDASSSSSGTETSSGSSSSSQGDKKSLERARNRLHARKSRARKKQCLENLQNELHQLHEEVEETKKRDEEVAREIQEKHNVWRHVLRKVCDLRAEGCTDEEAWLEVLTPDLRMTVPITPYRSFNPIDVVNNRRVLLGVDGMIADAQSLKVLRDNIGVKTRASEGTVSLQTQLASDNEAAFFNEDGLMCTFVMRTVDATKHGAHSECEQSGMIRARFNCDNKIEELDVTFDPIAFYHQLMRAQGRDDYPVVPNTLLTALKDDKSRIVVTTAERPFRITHVNKAWTDLCGFELEECQGKSLSILQGPETDMNRVADLCHLSQKGYASSMVVTNHNKKGELFRNHLRCYPVSSDDPGQISHIVGVLSSIPDDQQVLRGDVAQDAAMSAPPVPAF